MNKVKWCLTKKEGLQVVEPNDNLCKTYLLKAEHALNSMRKVTAKEWKISTAYYTSYFSLYALCIKIGIKCEIHSCTILFAKEYLKTYFTKEDILFITKSCKARIDTQYYTDKDISNTEYSKIIDETPLFYITCKSIISQLTYQEIKHIRNEISKI